MLRSNDNPLDVHVFIDTTKTANCCVVHFQLVVLKWCSSNSYRIQKQSHSPDASYFLNKLKGAVLSVQYPSICSEKSWTVLAWILSDHRKFQKFVTVRVDQILTLSDPQDFIRVPKKVRVAYDSWISPPRSDWLTAFLRQSWPIVALRSTLTTTRW